jgi:phosphoribosylamine--glycine ligase
VRFLVLSEGGDGIGLALRLQAEGNEVRIWIRESDAEKRGTGLVEHATNDSWGDIVVADCTGSGPILDHMAEHGAKVVGGSSLADRLETDREFSDEVMRAAGIPTPESRSFDDWDEAEEFIRSSKDRLVFKPEGSLSGNIPSYTPSDNKELLEAMDHFESIAGSAKPQFTLQQFIEGTCVSTEGWFDGEKWVPPFNHTIERKHFLDGDIGPSGGCTGNTVWPCDPDDPSAREGIAKMEKFLTAHLYRGPIDLNSVVNEEGLWGLEFTPRMGWDSLPTFLYGLYDGDFGELLYQIASGDGPKRMPLRDVFAAGIRISLPPWPSEKYAAEQGIPIRGITPGELLTDFYPYEVEQRDGKLFTSGGVGIIGVMNAYGDSIGEAFAKAYERVKRLKIPDMQYRTDLAEQCFHDYRELERILTGRKDMRWFGVDLDGTLAKYDGDREEIGEPIPLMVNRVKRWIADGQEVRVLTARAERHPEFRPDQIAKVHDWVKKNIGYPLHVTAQKDYEMKTLFDDRVKEVEEGTGHLVA